jgi:hypothetical protein
MYKIPETINVKRVTPPHHNTSVKLTDYEDNFILGNSQPIHVSNLLPIGLHLVLRHSFATSHSSVAKQSSATK